MPNYDAFGFEEKPKKPIWKKVWVWILVAVVIFVGVRQFGGGSKTASGDGQHQFEFDGATYEGIKSGDLAYTIIEATTTDSVGDGVHAKKAKGTFLLLDMGTYNYGSTTRRFGDRTFKVVDEDGKEYMESTAAKTALVLIKTPYLYDLSVAPSETVRGTVAFDIPSDKIDGQLQLVYVNEKGKETKVDITK